MKLRHDFETGVWTSPFEQRLANHAPLKDEHLAFIRAHVGPVQLHADEILFGRRSGQMNPLLVVAGWAAAAANLEDGRRQIVSLFLPGDLIEPATDLRNGLSAVALNTVRTLDAGELTAALAEGPTPALQPLLRAMALARTETQERLVRHVIRLGRLSAYERTADLLLELHGRLRRAGLADERGMHLAMTQEMLADYLGLSVVHMNRTLQQLRRDELILHRGGRLIIPDAGRLNQATRRSADA